MNWLRKLLTKNNKLLVDLCELRGQVNVSSHIVLNAACRPSKCIIECIMHASVDLSTACESLMTSTCSRSTLVLSSVISVHLCTAHLRTGYTCVCVMWVNVFQVPVKFLFVKCWIWWKFTILLVMCSITDLRHLTLEDRDLLHLCWGKVGASLWELKVIVTLFLTCGDGLQFLCSSIVYLWGLGGLSATLG